MERIRKFCKENKVKMEQVSIFHNVFDYYERSHELKFKKDGKAIIINIDKNKFNEKEKLMESYVIETIKRKLL